MLNSMKFLISKWLCASPLLVDFSAFLYLASTTFLQPTRAASGAMTRAETRADGGLVGSLACGLTAIKATTEQHCGSRCL